MVGMMRRFWQLLAVVMSPTVALAAPDPAPPANFAGAQYIDSRGCVFLRSDAGWQGRLDPDGQALCGFPPSLDMRRLDPDALHVLPPSLPPPAPDPAQILAERLAEQLREADLANSAPPPPATEISPTVNPLRDQIAASVAQSHAVRQSMGVAVPDTICARLGYQPGPIEGGVPDPTGFCIGMRAPIPGKNVLDQPSLAHVAARNPTTAVIAPALQPAPVTPRAGRAASPVTDTPVRPVAASSPPGTQQTTRPVASTSALAVLSDVEMIPAHARYVQLGVFRDDVAAQAAISMLADMGLPIARSRETPRDGTARVVLAGPFSDRQRLVETLNMLRARGWPGAVAR